MLPKTPALFSPSLTATLLLILTVLLDTDNVGTLNTVLYTLSILIGLVTVTLALALSLEPKYKCAPVTSPTLHCALILIVLLDIIIGALKTFPAGTISPIV
jgi:hypothetical protein